MKAPTDHKLDRSKRERRVNGSREADSATSRPSSPPSTAKRRLFGSVDHDQNRRDADRIWTRLMILRRIQRSGQIRIDPRDVVRETAEVADFRPFNLTFYSADRNTDTARIGSVKSDGGGSGSSSTPCESTTPRIFRTYPAGTLESVLMDRETAEAEVEKVPAWSRMTITSSNESYHQKEAEADPLMDNDLHHHRRRRRCHHRHHHHHHHHSSRCFTAIDFRLPWHVPASSSPEGPPLSSNVLGLSSSSSPNHTALHFEENNRPSHSSALTGSSLLAITDPVRPRVGRDSNSQPTADNRRQMAAAVTVVVRTVPVVQINPGLGDGLLFLRRESDVPHFDEERCFVPIREEREDSEFSIDSQRNRICCQGSKYSSSMDIDHHHHHQSYHHHHHHRNHHQKYSPLSLQPSSGALIGISSSAAVVSNSISGHRRLGPPEIDRILLKDFEMDGNREEEMSEEEEEEEEEIWTWPCSSSRGSNDDKASSGSSVDVDLSTSGGATVDGDCHPGSRPNSGRRIKEKLRYKNSSKQRRMTDYWSIKKRKFQEISQNSLRSLSARRKLAMNSKR